MAARRFGPFIVALALFVPPAAQGSESTPQHTGAARCGTCHPKIYESWKATPHARAMARLTTTQQKNEVCRSCHTMVPASDDPELLGVQCESCHGPGSLYAPEHVMRDDVLRDLLGLDKVTEATCTGCHAGATPNLEPFDFKSWIKQVNHAQVVSEKTAALRTP